jgi:hypothetical protein
VFYVQVSHENRNQGWTTHFTRVGVNENNGGFHINDGVACVGEVPVIKVPENTGLIYSGACLNGFVGLKGRGNR